MSIYLADAPSPVREDLAEAIRTAWGRLTEPGTWWTGQDRVHIAQETRKAARCEYCAKCKESVSPYNVEGDHRHSGVLPESVVDVIHRVVNDSARLTPTWFQEAKSVGLSEPAYVEVIAVIATVTAIDTFFRALGLETPGIPKPTEGQPTRTMPRGLRKKIAWVSTVSPKDAEPALKRAWWPDGGDTYVPRIHQAMSLVPNEVIAFRDLSEKLYLPTGALMDFSIQLRAITRAQMEIVAARVSALNECFY